MTHEIRKRIVRSATQEERERHQLVRDQIEQEKVELNQWAREIAAQHKHRVPVGTVFAPEEAKILEAMDEYAIKHALQNRGAVVREALANLLGIEIAR